MKQRTITILAAVLLVIALFVGWRSTKRSVTTVPVLMYHHLDPNPGNEYIISDATFARQLELLKENGYQAVSLRQLIDYVNGEGELPEKPFCITFDDGYYSNYYYAYPILFRLEYPATIFMVGSCLRPADEVPNIYTWQMPYLGAAEIREMVDSGLIAVQSHTYNMHQDGEVADETVRVDVMPLPYESKPEYRAALTEDLQLEREVLAQCGVEEVYAMAFPHGRSSHFTNEVLKDNGIQVTFSTDCLKVNRVMEGNPNTLFTLGRYNVTESTTDQELLAYLSRR